MKPGILIDQLRFNRRTPGASVVRSWPAGARLLELPNALVRVRSAGTGSRTILLTPDAPVVIENYGPLMELLAPHARVICFEFPGCGFSFPRFGFNFTLPDYVGVIRSVMDALQVERATLAFTCVNAMVAMAFARRHPDRVDHLVLSQVASVQQMHAFAQRIDIRIAGLGMFSTPVIGQLFMALKRTYVAHGWFKIALPRGFPADAIWNLAKPPMTRVARSVWRHWFRASRPLPRRISRSTKGGSLCSGGMPTAPTTRQTRTQFACMRPAR